MIVQLIVSLVDCLGDALLYEVCVNNVGPLGCDIIHAVPDAIWRWRQGGGGCVPL